MAWHALAYQFLLKGVILCEIGDYLPSAVLDQTSSNGLDFHCRVYCVPGNIMSAQPLMIIGDFNIHVDDSNDVYAVEFLDMLASMSLTQHVDVTLSTW